MENLTASGEYELVENAPKAMSTCPHCSIPIMPLQSPSFTGFPFVTSVITV